ncbi:MAG: hypothetical protein QM802_06865 [Agriterribacter sp.]
MTKFASFIILIAFISCNSQTTTATTDSSPVSKTDTSKKEVTYPYTMGYSSQFEFIDPEKGKMVLNMWKDFDNNSLDNSKDKFADTVSLQFPGMKLRSTRDSIIAVTKSYRGLYNAVASNVDVVMSVRSTDKKGDWVLVWGREIKTDKKNITDTTELHEVWGLNKEGKIEAIEQYIRH